MKASTRKTARSRTEPTERPAGLAAIKTILIPVDFGPPSLKALQYGCLLAKKIGAKVHLVHVNELAIQQPLLAPALDLATDFGHQLRRRLQALGAECAPSITAARCHVRTGKASEQIRLEARLLDADLILMATHGYKGLKHVMLGSTTERVVRQARCPVLIVRAANRTGAALRLNRILVPTDFSEHSRDALRYAIAFGKRFNATLTLLNLIYPQYYVTNPDYLPYDFGELFEETRRAAKRDVAALVEATSFGGVPFKTRIEEGHPTEHILEFAAKSGADLIITSTHGRTGLKHAVLGSIAEQVVRYAKCPVLVVPRAEGKARTGGKR